MTTEIIVEETGTVEATDTLNDATRIAETIVEQARRMAGDNEVLGRMLAELYDKIEYHAAAAATAHAEIMRRLDALETTVAVASVVTEEAIEDALDIVTEEIVEEVEAVEESVEEVAEETATENAEQANDEPEVRSRKRRFI